MRRQATLLHSYNFFATFQFSFDLDSPKIDGVTAARVPRSPNKLVTMTFDLRSWKVLFIKIFFRHV